MGFNKDFVPVKQFHEQLKIFLNYQWEKKKIVYFVYNLIGPQHHVEIRNGQNNTLKKKKRMFCIHEENEDKNNTHNKK